MNNTPTQELTSALAAMWERRSARVLPIGAHAMGETWRVEFRDGQTPAIAVLKRVPEDVAGTDILARVRLIERLCEAGVSELRVVPTVYGTRSALMDDGRIYLLFDWIDGDEFNANHPNAFTEAGAYMAEFHRAVAQYDDPLFPRPKGGISELWRGEILRRAELLVDSPCPTRWLDRLEQTLHMAHPPSAELPTCVVHGDFRAQNLRFRHGRARALLDLDGAHIGTRIADLTYTLLFYASVYRGGPMSAQETEEILRAYTRGNPLTEGERESLPAWLHLALWRGVSLWLQLHFVDGFPERTLSWARLFGDDLSWFDARVQQVREWVRSPS
ncbi:hypothetical protein FJZ36_06685 [Candidatus Poribacteria bacterium]|nr:hypothetical protein [Candidatus Poribacteria bacterium]